MEICQNSEQRQNEGDAEMFACIETRHVGATTFKVGVNFR